MRPDKILKELNADRAGISPRGLEPLELDTLTGIQQKIGELEILLRNAFGADFCLMVFGHGRRLHPNEE